MYTFSKAIIVAKNSFVSIFALKALFAILFTGSDIAPALLFVPH